MFRIKRNAAVLLLVVFCVGCDQITKDVAQQYLALEPPHSWLHDTVRLEYAKNRGAFLSVGGDLSQELRVLLFQVFPALWLTALGIFLFVSNHLPISSIFAWALVLSGGFGNLLDRITYDGYVVDFMNLGIGSLRTGIFNVADVCITTGVVMLMVQTVWPQQPPLRSNPQR